MTSLVSMVYSDDQYRSGQPNSPSCTTSGSSTSSCDHTAIATQTSGPGIFATTSTGNGKGHGKP